MVERSPVKQAMSAVLISFIVLGVIAAAAWFVTRSAEALGTGPLPSTLPPRNAYILTIATGLLSFATGGITLLGVRQAKFFTPQFAWLVYLIVSVPLVLLLFTPLQRFDHPAFFGLPLFLMSVPGRTVVAVAVGALLLGALDLRRVMPGLVHE